MPLNWRSSARQKERSDVSTSMGFREVPRQQAFEAAVTVPRVIYDRPAASISSWVGRGLSAVNETAIFDFSYDQNSAFTVVGFRMRPSVPDFEIRHFLKGKDWMFVFRWGARAKSSKQYPDLLEEAVGWSAARIGSHHPE